MKKRLSQIKTVWIITIAMMLNGAATWAIEYPGYIKVENFDNIAGDAVAGMLTAAKYTNNQPDSVTFLSSLYWSRNPAADNYGSRISGFLTPSETAAYVFFVASDNDSSLYLSTDSTPANLKLIAADQGWQNARTWTGVGGTSSGDGTTNVVFRRGFNPGPTVLETNGFQWVGPFQNRSDQFLNSPATNLLASAAQRWPTTDANGNAVINLVANQKYYFEYLFKEGGGGDNSGVAWKKASDPDPDNGVTGSEIQGQFLSVEWPAVLTFQAQPTNQTVSEGQFVSFRAIVLGVPGDSDTTLFTYQWYVNNTPITDGTGNAATYQILSAAASDNGKQYKVGVASAGTSPAGILTATSSVATLTVISDPIPPRISRIRSSDSFASAKITFSEAVRNEAVTPANYVFGGGLTVTDANFDIVVDAATEDPKNPLNPLNRVAVILFTSAQTEGASYALTVNNVKDLIGNNLAPNNTTTMYANVFQAGVLSYKRWMGLGSVQNLTTDPANAIRFADPDFESTITVAETPFFRDNDIDYVERLNGFFIPTVTTNYVFYVCADNNGFLYLSTDAAPANRKLIAADVGWQNQRVWTGPGGDTPKRRGDTAGGGPFENRSDQFLTSARASSGNGLPGGAVIADGTDPEPWPTTDVGGNAVMTLTAGTRYAFQLWHEEFDGGRFEATFKFSGEADPADNTVSRITSGLIGAYVDPTSLLPVITGQPTNVNFTVGGTINLSVTASSFSQPITYQWSKNGAVLTGATTATLTINNASVDDVGSYFVAVANENGAVNSATVAVLTPVTAPGLTFQEDGTGLTVIEAEHYYSARTADTGKLWVPTKGRSGNSGPGYVSVLPDTGQNLGNAGYATSARLDFRIQFVNAGLHYLWLRGGDPTAGGAGDSVHAGINDVVSVAGTQITGAPTFNTLSWNWVGTNNASARVTVDVPSAGIHTVNLWMREDGFLLDKLILTTDAAFTPTGTGPAESAVVTPGPTLSIGRNGANIVITYTGTLLSAPTVNGTYTTVTGASGGSYTVSPTNTQQYFRAQQ